MVSTLALRGHGFKSSADLFNRVVRSPLFQKKNVDSFFGSLLARLKRYQQFKKPMRANGNERS